VLREERAGFSTKPRRTQKEEKTDLRATKHEREEEKGKHVVEFE
jgi:hypothetical protein